jgi:glycerate 2-kinase
VKHTAQRIFRETLAAVNISEALAKGIARSGSHLSAGNTTLDLHDYREIVAIAFGKASFAMAQSLTELFAPEYGVAGILVVPAGAPRRLPDWRMFLGGHPVPNGESFAAGRAILDRLARCDERTLIFFLISGGGSSLVEQPLNPGLTLEDFQKLHSALVTCGGSIEEINVVRKHLSGTKGGRLAAAAPRSMKLTLAISDVPPGEESALASGPTLPDPSTIRDAERVAAKYQLLGQFPPAIRAAFERESLVETPKEGDAAFALSHFVEILGERELLHSAHRACEAAGYISLCDSVTDGWPIEKASDHLLALLEAQKKANPGRPVAVVASGEVSSPVMGNGVGGRNSAFVLACVPKISGKPITVISAGTDGIDGNSPAAGAVADGETLARARAVILDPEEFLSRSDAYNFFARLGDGIITGPTGNNLRDLRILLMA